MNEAWIKLNDTSLYAADHSTLAIQSNLSASAICRAHAYEADFWSITYLGILLGADETLLEISSFPRFMLVFMFTGEDRLVFKRLRLFELLLLLVILVLLLPFVCL